MEGGEEGHVGSAAAIKRKASEASMASATKKMKNNSELLFDFEPESELPDYIPESLTILKRSTEFINLPIFLKGREETIRVHCEYRVEVEDKDF